MSRRIYTYAGRDGEWSIASAPEIAVADVDCDCYPDGAIAFEEADGRIGAAWYRSVRRRLIRVRKGGTLYVASEADAVRLVAAGGPRVR